MEQDLRSTRERVLDVALDLFVEQGYDKTSIREIAEQMGFTKAALYYHFHSKGDILLALHQRLHGLMDGPLGLLGDGPVSLDAFEKFLDACIDGMQANQKLFILHRVNQAAVSKVHMEGHEENHRELEVRFRSLLSDPALPAKVRTRMAAALAAAFATPLMTGNFSLGPGTGGLAVKGSLGGDDMASGRGGTGDDAARAADNPDFVSDLKEVVRQVLRAN
jgi:AcrR family transcriptional regulator